jgi:DNA-binding NarL/FixJ family response regulator
LRVDGPRVIGRERELTALRSLAAGEATARTLVLSGEPGTGKTALWEAGVAEARARGAWVLHATPGDGEGQVDFAALVDLLDGVDLEALADLPPPQRRALEEVLLLAEPADEAASPHAIRVGFLGALRALATRSPVVVAVDDLQWLDAASSGTLAFACRRTEPDRVRFLLARRGDASSDLERTLERWGVERLAVGPLSLGAIRRLLWERLGLTMRRSQLRRIVDVTLGNPLFALEIGRALADEGPPAIGEELAIPDTIEDVLGLRIARLSAPVARLLLTVAVGSDLRAAELEAIADGDLGAAVDAGVLLVDGSHVRASHPLLAAAARQRSTAAVRRSVHRELAAVARDGDLRTRHLALAADWPDAELATSLAAGAARAASRGRTQDAVELAQHALRLTPFGSAERSERLLGLAGYLETAGERQRVTDLLEPELSALPAGAARVRALLLLSEGGSIATYGDHRPYFARALTESGGDPLLRAWVLATEAINVAAEGVERIRTAESWALEALAAAPAGGPELERLALRALGWARSLLGLPIDDVCGRFRAASSAAFHLADSPEPVAGLRLTWRGELEPAAAMLAPFLELADERGEAVSYAWLRLNACELALRGGDWPAASRLLDEWAESDDGTLLIAPTYKRCRALVAAGRGDADGATLWGTSALVEAEARGYRWQILESRRALGLAALAARDPGSAARHLGAVWDHTVREEVEEPGAFPVAPDLVEALIELEELDEARAVAERLRRLADEQRHPWATATAQRCEAMLQLAASPRAEQPVAALARAAAAYGALRLPFDQARTLLALGRSERRARRWGSARAALEDAAAALDELGSPGWAEQARSEVGRVGARRPQVEGQLTPAEQRVVELAAEGLANKEIAQRLVVTVHTVEAHLTRAYAKLGVRSRAQLAARLAAGSENAPTP